MSLRILFADDSVTAQNMGKKILTEAGYDVVAVSNGAAAVKKIAEQKPDIIILDVYMPGYSGLEVCEKVRGSIETLKTPVLLTVGKMEPYKPEEANRVRADGVIVKPFEASDLLAIMKKFEERISQAAAAPPLAQRSVAADRFDETLQPEHPEAAIVGTIPQATVEVPDHMATTSAFSDLLGADPSHSLGQFNANQSGVARNAAPRSEPHSAQIPDYDLPVSWRKDIDPFAPSTMSSPANNTVAEEKRSVPPPTPLRPRQIPVYQDGEPPRRPEVVPTAAPPIGDIEISREPALQESAAEATRNTVVEAREPGLVPTMQQAAETASASVQPAPPEDANANANAEAVISEAKPQVVETSADEPPPGPRLVSRTPGLDAVETKISESDFEARVAAAMAAYNQASPRGAVPEKATKEPPAVTTEVAGGRDKEIELRPFVAAPSASAETTKPPLPQRGALPVSPKPMDANSADPAKAVISNSVTSHLEAAAAAAGAEAGSDHSTIAQAVHRVMERLKPELVEEIMKELKSKK